MVLCVWRWHKEKEKNGKKKSGHEDFVREMNCSTEAAISRMRKYSWREMVSWALLLLICETDCI